jgi:hypothetical protein
MMKPRPFPYCVGVVLVALAAATVSAQTLADVARAEEARRKGVKETGKVYTNEDLKHDGPAGLSGEAPKTPPGEGAAAAAGSTSGQAAAPAAPKEEEPKKDQAYWSGRIKQARSQLERSKVLLAALDSRINALNTDFVNRDDPAQRAVIEQDRHSATAEMARVRKEIEEQTKAVADIEDEARRAGVPPGWLR